MHSELKSTISERRIFLAGSPYFEECTLRETDRYLELGNTVTVNEYLWGTAERQLVRARYAGVSRLSIVCVDPNSPGALTCALLERGAGFHGIICPPNVQGLTLQVLQTLALRGDLKHRLRVIGCPNDSLSHLSGVVEYASRHGIAILNSPDSHAQVVAEYTLNQMGFHARRLSYFYAETGRNGSWPHDLAIVSTRSLRGRTLGVIGSGRDGGAVIALGLQLGMRVVALSSGSAAGMQRIRELGAEVASTIGDLVACSDFISINCRLSQDVPSLLATAEIERMKRGVVIVNPAAAEVFEKDALLQEFRRPLNERHIGVLVLDMPFGRRRDAGSFLADPDNDVLKSLGVLFTPRMAGYTFDAHMQTVVKLASDLTQFLQSNVQQDLSSETRSGKTNSVTLSPQLPAPEAFLADALRYCRQAGAEAIRLREQRLEVAYKSDGSPTTNADLAAEAIIREGLRSRGHIFRFLGEESCDCDQSPEVPELIIDGIDGTRNFRDGNYGWCISLAVRVGGHTVLGVIYDAQSAQTYYATRSHGAFLRFAGTSRPLRVPTKLYEDFSYSVGSFRIAGATQVKTQIMEDIKKLGGRAREWGSVALSICAVARGGLGVFIQANSHLHDHVAAVLVAEEAGASVALLGQNDPDHPDVIVSHPSLSSRIVEIFKQRAAGAARFAASAGR